MSDDMALPEGMTCGDCLHWLRCLSLICTLPASGTRCDWSPSRFVQANTVLIRDVNSEGEDTIVSWMEEVKRLRKEIGFTAERLVVAEHEVKRLRVLLRPFVDLAREHCAGPYVGLDDWPIKIEIPTGILRSLIR